MRYAKGFFDLQLAFARAVVDSAGLSFAQALMDYTNLYIRFGLGRAFDPEHPGWQEYLAGLREAQDHSAWTYHFYCQHPDGMAAPAVVARFGCFAYGRLSDDRIRLHFENAETDGRSPLAMECRRRRRLELAALFAHVQDTAGDAVRVVGASWLYNLDAYRCLFPEPYLATAHVLPRRFRHMPLWGQFLDRRGEIREKAACEFRDRLAGLSSAESADQCFPLPVLGLEAPARVFYAVYGA